MKEYWFHAMRFADNEDDTQIFPLRDAIRKGVEL